MRKCVYVYMADTEMGRAIDTDTERERERERPLSTNFRNAQEAEMADSNENVSYHASLHSLSLLLFLLPFSLPVRVCEDVSM